MTNLIFLQDVAAAARGGISWTGIILIIVVAIALIAWYLYVRKNKQIGISVPKKQNLDESSVRLGADIVFVCSIIFALVIFGYSIYFLQDGFTAMFGYLGLVIGLIFILCGWIMRASIRLFANMSDRLNSIDKKLK